MAVIITEPLYLIEGCIRIVGVVSGILVRITHWRIIYFQTYRLHIMFRSLAPHSEPMARGFQAKISRAIGLVV